MAEQLWRDGLNFDLHVVGRINPHFGRPIAQQLKELSQRRPGLHFHEAASDVELALLLAKTRAVVFPTIAEGCGLPVLEALWRGLPCVCSDLPVLRENTDEGGCMVLPKNDLEAWSSGLRDLLTHDEHWRELARSAAQRELPTWADAAEYVRATLSD